MLWLVVDNCSECGMEAVAVFDRKKDAQSLCHAFGWLDWIEIDTEELILYSSQGHRYEEWFNQRADRALQQRSHDCD